MAAFIARPFTAANPKEQTLGVVLSWMADNLKSDAIRPVMAQHGFGSVDSARWYPTQQVQDVIRDLCKEPDTMNIFIAMGKKFALELPYAANVQTIPDALAAFNATYHTLNRDVDPAEGLVIEETQPGTLVITNNTPWPGELIYGLLSTLSSRFKAGPAFRVKLLPPDEYLRSVFEVSQAN